MSKIHQVLQRVRAERQAHLQTTRHFQFRPESLDGLKKSESKRLDQAPQNQTEQPVLSPLDEYEESLALPIVPKPTGILQATQRVRVQPQATAKTARADTVDGLQDYESEASSYAPPIIHGTEREATIVPQDDKNRPAIPIFLKTDQKQPQRKKRIREPFVSRGLTIRPDPMLVSLFAPKAIVSEQYRTLRAKILQMEMEKGLKTLLVASTGPSEGKTLTAINLALTMAQEIDLKILIVDGDLRRPAVHRYLGTPHAEGLSDYLSQNCSLESIVCNTNLRNFFVVSAGTVAEKPAELLNSSRMDDFLSYAVETFDWVILDSPPLTALADAHVLASKVDGILFVVRAFQTPISLFQKSLESLRAKNIVGVVFNGDTDEEASKYSAYYGHEKNRAGSSEGPFPAGRIVHK